MPKLHHPAKPQTAADGSLRWRLTPHHHSPDGHAAIYGRLAFEVDVQDRASLVGRNVYVDMDGAAVRARSCLSPDEAEALAHALLKAAAQARDNAESQDFLDYVHQRMTAPDYDPELETFCHPQVHYCHPDDFIAACAQFGPGHIVISRNREARIPATAHANQAAQVAA